MKAGAPNISGEFTPGQGDEGGIANFASRTAKVSGCFSMGTSISFQVLTETDGRWIGAPLRFSAKSNIYGNSTTITPLSMKTKWFVKY